MSQKIKLSLVISISIFLLFTQANNVFAIEGTCSWHGGVNCDAMADWDGSAVCNDGWLDSSELFSSVDECKSIHHFCTTAEFNQLETKYDLAGKNKKTSDIRDQIIQLAQSNALTNPSQNSDSISDLLKKSVQQGDITSKILALQEQLYPLDREFWNASNEEYRECYAMGDQEFYQAQADFLKQLSQQNENDLSRYTCTIQNAHPISKSQCACDNGFTFDGKECSKPISQQINKSQENTQMPTNNFKEDILRDPTLCKFSPWKLEPECQKSEVKIFTPPIKSEDNAIEVEKTKTQRPTAKITQIKPVKVVSTTTAIQDAGLTVTKKKNLSKPIFRDLVKKMVSPFRYFLGKIFK